MTTEFEVCQRCKKNPAVEMHTCPFGVEIYECKDECNCCDGCANECADDI